METKKDLWSCRWVEWLVVQASPEVLPYETQLVENLLDATRVQVRSSYQAWAIEAQHRDWF